MNAGPGGPRGRGRRAAVAGFCDAPGAQPYGDEQVGRGPGGGRYRRSVLEAAILASIAESTTHGYDLVQQISALAADLVCIDPGSMYRLLRELEEQGLVTSSWQTPESGPSKRVYTITEQGVEALQMMAEGLTARANATRRLADHSAAAAAKAKSELPTS